MIAVLEATDEVFNDVPDIKRQNTQFKLLPKVDAFVINQNGTRIGLPNQNKGKQGHAINPQRCKMHYKHDRWFYILITRKKGK